MAVASPSTGSSAASSELHRQLLARALRTRGYGKVCHSEPPDHTVLATRMSQRLLSAVLVGLVLFGLTQLDLTLWQALGAVALLMLLAAVVGLRTGALLAIYLVFLIGWVGLGAMQLLGPGLGALSLTHLLPFGIVAGGVAAWRALHLVLAIPVVLPVVFLLVATPLLSADPWQVADAAGAQLGWFAGVAVGPLLALVIGRHLRAPVSGAFDAAVERVTRLENPEERVSTILRKVSSNEDASLNESATETLVRKALRQPNIQREAVTIGEVVAPSYRRRSVLRLIRLGAGVFVLVAVLTYVLAWAAVPLAVADKWVGHPVTVKTAHLIGFDAVMPVGPYVGIALLLAIVATAGFFAFALTEDRYSVALSDAVTQGPAVDCLLLSLSYRSLQPQKERASDRRRAKAA